MLTFKKPMWLLVPVAVVAGYLWGRARPRFRHSIRTSLFKQYVQHAAAATVYPSMTYVGQPLGTIRREVENGRVSTIEVIQGHDPLRPNTVLHVFARLRDGTGIALEEPTLESAEELLRAARQYNAVAPPDRQVMVQATS